MSRSYREPWIRDSGTLMRKYHSRAVRTGVKARLRVLINHPELWEAGPDIPDPKAVTNQYDISDYRFYSKDPRARCK